MTKSTIKKTNKVKLSEMSDADQIRAFTALLKAQPDIFQKEPRLVEFLQFGDHKQGNITTLANRQTQRLKEELSKNKRRTQDLLNNARHYDELTNNTYNFIFDLLACQKIDHLLDTVAIKSPNLFAIDFVAVKSTLTDHGNTRGLQKHINKDFIDNNDYQHVMARLAQGKCLCSDRFPESVLKFFFAEDSSDVKSVAFIPLVGKDNNAKNALGILAYGSKDKNKFSSGLRGTVHLERIGKAVALSVERILVRS